MKKIAFLLLATLLSSTTFAKTTLPYISRHKDTSGKYGFVQDGKEVIPHIFDGARSFLEGEAMTYVECDKEHFVIDRNGNMVTDKGYKVYPNIYPRFAIVDRICEYKIDSSYGTVINSRGEQLLPGSYAKTISISLSEKESYHLLAVSKNRKTFSGQLSTINGEAIGKNLFGDFSSMQSGAILYADASSNHSQGVINAWGQILVPCQYEEISFYSLSGIYSKDRQILQKAGVLSKYSEELQKRVGIIYAKSGRLITLYDQSGTQLTSAQVYKNTYYRDVFKKHYKKVIIPHFLRKGEIMRSVQEKINNPNKARYDEYVAQVAKLPTHSSSKTSIVSKVKEIEANPKVDKYSVSECYAKGVAYYDKNKYTEAIPWLLRAAEGKYSAAYRKLADSYNNSKQFKKAWEWYNNCVRDLTPDSNDYWFACMMLGGMYKAGRGCEKNYDKSLQYLRMFYNNTTQINKQTASDMISEVVALQNKENPRQQVASSLSRSRSQSSSNSGTITAEDFMRHSDVGRPSYGSIPTNVDIYMKSTNKDRLVVNKLWFFTHNGDYILKINNGGPGLEYKLTETTSDSFLFQPCRQVISSSYNTFNSINVSYQTQYGSPIVIRKDWSQLIDASMERYFGKKILTSMATKAEYDAYMKASTAMVNMFQAMSGDSGGGGGSSVAPAQIQSGMSAEYYQNLYRQYERLAESAYRSLTSTGVSVRYEDGSREGSTLGSWEGSNYVGMKVELGKAQREMQRIRSEAAREGHHIMQSHWETATVSH